MIVELGHFALILALFVAVAQSFVPMVGAVRSDLGMMRVAGPMAQAQFILCALSFAGLTWAYLTSDFSVLNVLKNSHSAKPLIYKITGVWANHEGSMMLWVLILALFGALVGVFGRSLTSPFRARVLSIQGMIGVGFYLFILLTSNPFERVGAPPMDGRGMNPLLQDPGIAIHPPFLYLGYVGLSIAFSFAVAALIEGRVDASWARWVRPWTLAAWAALTAGIALGSWWAYYELGWGGFWFWDPVENASFMPWLMCTALVHSVIVVEKRDALKKWTVLLAILAFSLSLIGTFLVRSGVLTSVHAFATDPTRGVFILILLGLAIGGSLFLYAMRAPDLEPGGLFQPISREGGLLFNNLMLTTCCATVFLGTLYPLFMDSIGGGKVSVGPPYFNATFGPIFSLLVAVAAIGPLLPWKRGDLLAALSRLKIAFIATIVVAGITFWMMSDGPALAALAMGLATWMFAATLNEFADRIRLFRIPLGDSLKRAAGLPRSAYGMTLSHAGLAILVAGVTGISAWRVENLQTMLPGESREVAGYEMTLIEVREVAGPNYRSQMGTVEARRDGDLITTLHPEKRWYTVQRQDTTEAAIHTMFLGDLYVALGEQNPSGAWVVRLYFNPTVPWIWFGSILMVIGGMFSLSDHRLRVGAPKRRIDSSPKPPAGAGIGAPAE